jgi:hypothetical protein
MLVRAAASSRASGSRPSRRQSSASPRRWRVDLIGPSHRPATLEKQQSGGRRLNLSPVITSRDLERCHVGLHLTGDVEGDPACCNHLEGWSRPQEPGQDVSRSVNSSRLSRTSVTADSVSAALTASAASRSAVSRMPSSVATSAGDQRWVAYADQIDEVRLGPLVLPLIEQLPSQPRHP